MSQSGDVNFLVESGRMVYRCTAFGNVVKGEDVSLGRSCGGAEGDVAALDHETGHEAVEGGVVVCAACAECEEVLRRSQ